MPKAVKVREGAEYLPKIDTGDLRRMRDLLPCGKPRLRVQAAILRKRVRSVGWVGTALGENPSTMHNRLLRLARGACAAYMTGPARGGPASWPTTRGPGRSCSYATARRRADTRGTTGRPACLPTT